jgi:hypothetical protein
MPQYRYATRHVSATHRARPDGASAQRGTVGGHGPWTTVASPAPGHGGIVAPIADSGSSPNDRNWNFVPSGMVRERPRETSTTSVLPSCSRHISPRPARKYQISSTVLCIVAVEVSPGASWKWANPPAARTSRTRTSEPSGATSVRSDGNLLESKAGTDSLVRSWEWRVGQDD